MKIVIFNELTFSVHIAAIRTAPQCVRFEFSRRRLPVPDGEVIGRFDIDPGEAAEAIMPDTGRRTVMARGLGPNVSLRSANGTDKHGNRIKVLKLKPSDTREN